MNRTAISPKLHGRVELCALYNAAQQMEARGNWMRILIVDDHPIVASGCRTVLADEPDIVIIEASDA
jgi:hypothetical protein